MSTQNELPNGPVAAAFLAGGIGSAVLGLSTILATASEGIKNALTWNSAVGSLTGKSLLSTIVFFACWAVLHFMYKDKDVDFQRWALIAYILIAIGLLGTFPPVFEAFASH